MSSRSSPRPSSVGQPHRVAGHDPRRGARRDDIGLIQNTLVLLAGAALLADRVHGGIIILAAIVDIVRQRRSQA